MRKKLFTFLLALVTSVGLMNAAVDDSGSCGDNVTYSFNGTTGEMVISGTGPMTVYTYGSSLLPWKDYKDAITSVVVEDGVTSVSQYTFGKCTNLTTVVIGNNVETIGQFAFNDCGTSFTSLTLGSSLKSVGMAAFLNAKGITTLTLPDGFETVGDYAFCRLEALQTLNIPSSVKSIGTSAFYRCYPLATINCAAVTPPSLGDDAFGDIANKSNIPLYVPNGSVAAYDAAAQWTDFNIQGYDPAPAPANVCGDGLTWELNGGVLTISYDGVGTGEMTNFDYENESPVIVAPWKENKSEITTVIVGDGVKSIGNYAFNDLSENFTAVTIANSVERIGVFAFANSEEITAITLPSSLKTIDERGFANCGFTSITIPSGVTSIGYQAFSWCRNLTSLTCEATTPPILDDGVFYKVRSTTSSLSSIPLYVPSGSVTAYEAAAQWNAFDIQAIPAPAPSGDKLSGVFSVSGTKAVCFSKGNLQYDSNNQIWQFAANQWDYIGNAAGNTAITVDGIPDNSGIVDLFGWVGASSSWTTGSTKQYGISYSTTSNDYGNVYGEALKQDWGNTMGSDWRTLTKDEWNYLLTERDNAENLRTLATVNGKSGLILMPDGWTASGVSLTVTKENYTDNTIGSSDWATLAGQGCVFLPAAGSRNGNWIMSAGTKGHYWSSTSRSDGASLNSFKLVFMADDVDPTDYTNRYTGLSVRLVSETAPAPTPTPTGEQVPTNADPENPSYHYSTFFHSTQNYKLSNDGTQAFIADLSNNELVLTEIANGTQVIPANTAVILRKTGSADPVVLTPTEENGVSVNPDDNSLEGVDVATLVTDITGLTLANCYVLSGTNEHGVGFYKINGNTLKAHKAYVKYAGSSNNAPKKMRFVYGQATGIEDVQGNNVQSTKVIENGVLYIIRDGKTYNAMGQMVK